MDARQSTSTDGRGVLTPIAAGSAQLPVLDAGAGEPVVFIQTALTADELVPVATRLPERFRTILYRRRGYGEGAVAENAGSIGADAADCVRLLDAMQITRAHAVGLSYSAAVAMQLAADAPQYVQSLTLLEPPPIHASSAAEFRAANERLLATRRAQGLEVALEEFLTLVVGEQWRTDMERDLPGSVRQMRRDARAFFDTDIPALLAWRFSAQKAGRIRCPVVHVGGTESGAWFADVRRLMLEWFPHAEDVSIEGAGHSLAITHADEVAAAIASFLHRHPMSSDL